MSLVSAAKRGMCLHDQEREAAHFRQQPAFGLATFYQSRWVSVQPGSAWALLAHARQVILKCWSWLQCNLDLLALCLLMQGKSF